MQLDQIQQYFKQVLIKPECLNDTKNPARLTLINNNGVSLEDRLAVYRNNVLESLSNAVLSALPNTQAVVGTGFLKQALKPFILENLPEEGNLNLYGLNFPAFLETYEPANTLYYLPDLVRLELLIEKAHYAADDKPLNLESLVKIDPDAFPSLRFEFRQAVSLLHSPYALLKILELCDAARNHSNTPQEQVKFADDEPCYILIFRKDPEVKLMPLSYSSFVFLNALKNQCNIMEAAQAVEDAELQIDITAVLRQAFQLNLFFSKRT